MAENEKTYAEGIVEGELKILTQLGKTQTTRLNDHSKRLRMLEKAMWITLGMVLFIQLWPAVQVYMAKGIVQ